MATTATLRSRRSAAQLHALVGVEREIRSYDPNSRRKYLCEFSQAFRSYHSVLDATQLHTQVNAADIVLIGDYHALPTCQRFAAGLLEQRALAGDRPVVLGLETIFSRDQHILDEWWRRDIESEELRQRMRFDLDWGYDWTPFYELLVTAREHAEGVYGLDCMPREDLRKIGARDRHAADKIAEIRQRHPRAAILVLFGESHLAPGHLPRALRDHLPEEGLLTVLQNVDALYWHAAGEQRERVEAVRVAEDVLCVFNSTPLEKYESYRLYLDRWSRGGIEGPDLAPTLYNLIDGLLRFLNINRYSPHNTTQPKFLVDMLPEVYCPTSDALLRRLLSRKGVTEEEKEIMMRRVEERGSAYLPQVNAFYVREFQMVYAAEEAARFLHHACLGLPERSGNLAEEAPADSFYRHALEYALAYFGSRVLYPARPTMRDANLYESYNLSREEVERTTAFSHADFTKFTDFLILHREFETRPQRYPDVPKLISDGMRFTGNAHDYLTRQLGYLLGSDLYDSYLEGRVSRADLRKTFLTHLEAPGTARKAYLELAGRVRLGKKKMHSASD